MLHRPMVLHLIDAAAEQLRRILTGPGSITALPVDERLLERDHRDELTKLRRQVSEWDSESPGAPSRAMVMLDKPQPVTPVVFLAGNRQDEMVRRCPAAFHEFLPAPNRRSSPTAAAGWDWPKRSSVPTTRSPRG